MYYNCVWRNYSIGSFRRIFIPDTLRDCIDKYCETTQVKITEIFDSAIYALFTIWKEDSEKIREILRYNPPPKMKKRNYPIMVRFPIGADPVYNMVQLLESNATVRSTEDFIRRAISWYLRKEGFLEPIKIAKVR